MKDLQSVIASSLHIEFHSTFRRFVQRQEKNVNKYMAMKSSFSSHHIILFFLQYPLFLAWAFNIVQKKKKHKKTPSLVCRTSCTPYWITEWSSFFLTKYLSVWTCPVLDACHSIFSLELISVGAQCPWLNIYIMDIMSFWLSDHLIN